MRGGILIVEVNTALQIDSKYRRRRHLSIDLDAPAAETSKTQHNVVQEFWLPAAHPEYAGAFAAPLCQFSPVEDSGPVELARISEASG
jgi:hypothetical protein